MFVSDKMTSNPVTIFENASIPDANSIKEEKSLNNLPVIKLA
jgi:CBS domain-containing protein